MPTGTVPGDMGIYAEAPEERESTMLTVNEVAMKKIAYIADHYGYESQSRQVIEEAAELIQAINKHWRAVKFGSVLDVADTRGNMLEELSDVWLTSFQIMYLTCGEDEVNKFLREKVERQIRRIDPERIKENEESYMNNGIDEGE